MSRDTEIDVRFRGRPVSDAFKRAQDHETHTNPEFFARKGCEHCQAFLVLMAKAPVARRRR